MSIVQDAVAAAIKKANGVVDTAVPLLVAAARKSPKLYRAMCDPFLDGIARDLLNAETRRMRSRVAKGADNLNGDEEPLPDKDNPPDHSERIDHYGASVLMFYPLLGGKYLKDATVDDLTDSIDRRTKQVQTETRRLNFETVVCEALRKSRGKTVGDALTEAKVNALWKDTE